MPAEALPAHLGSTKPGLVLKVGARRSTFLPQVWEQIPQPVDFLENLCAKQGSPQGCWKDPAARFETYSVQYLAEGK